MNFCHFYDILIEYNYIEKKGYYERNTNNKLDQFLKFVNVVSSGIEAKIVIKDGQVKVNGEVELRRGKKLHNQDEVEVNGEHYIINAYQ